MSHQDFVIRLENLSKRFDDEYAVQDVNLDVRHGEFLTLLGPSGCGKTTILRLIAGFEQPDEGRVFIGGRPMDGLPPDQRRVNTVFQSYALFPHMNVFDNVAFGLRMEGAPKGEVRERVMDALRIVHLEKFAQRRPDSLSGGQQQRVAIARAVVNKPRALLLDEPLSALDYKLRQRMQMELKQLRRTLGITFIFVTHDQEEAFSMSDRVAVLNQGRIEQLGTPVEVYEEPVNLFVAEFVGQTNILDAVAGERVGGEVGGEAGGRVKATVEGMETTLLTGKEFAPGKNIKVVLRPEDLLVERDVPEDDDKLWLPGVIEETIYKGSTWDMIIGLECGKRMLVTEFFDEDAEEMSFQAGEKVVVSWYAGWEVVLANGSDPDAVIDAVEGLPEGDHG